MAEVLKDFTFPKGRRADIYGRYLDGQTWRIERNEITGTTMRGAQTTIATRAKKMGLMARTMLVDRETALIVQAFNADGSPIVTPLRQVG